MSAGIGPRTERQLRSVRWGLVPSWTKDPSVGNRLINAQVETTPEKPSFRHAFAKRRRILPTVGCYEWQKQPARNEGGKEAKQPYFIHRPDDGTLVMGGLYELWRDPSRERDDPEAWLWTVTVLTTDAIDEPGRIHDRAPSIVPAGAYDAWLATRTGNADKGARPPGPGHRGDAGRPGEHGREQRAQLEPGSDQAASRRVAQVRAGATVPILVAAAEPGIIRGPRS